MAQEVVTVENNNLEELEGKITCAICQDHYTEPKVLPCLHYYCKQCILTHTGPERTFSCVKCCKEKTLSEGCVDKLPTAFFVNRLKTTFTILERAHGKEDVKCEACTDSGAKAEAFCRQCEMFVCNYCVESHQRLKKIFDGHEVISFQELKERRAKEVIMKEPPTKKCPVHKEPLIVYCFDCNSLICRDCIVKDHRDHNFEFSRVEAPKVKENLGKKLESLKKVGFNLSHAVQEIQTTQHELKAQGDSVTNTIQTSFQELHDILERCKQELLEEAGMKVREKMAKLSEQEKNLSLASAEVQSVLDYTEQFVEYLADNEITCMHVEITSRIEEEKEKHDVKINTPVGAVDVEDMCGEVLLQLCQTKTKIAKLCCIHPAKFTVGGEGVKAAEVHQIAEFTLNSATLPNKTNRCAKVNCQLKSLYDGSIIKCNVDRIGAGEYHIQYTPTVRGQHELTVSVDGQQVGGSPFPVFVSIPPTQLGKPVKVWGVKNPACVTVFNSVEDIVVTEWNGDVVIFDKEGKRLRSIERSEPDLHTIIGVTVDFEDNIYFVGYETNTLYKCNRNGDIQRKRVKQVKGPGYRGVAVVGDEVAVCERYNKGTIVVYNRDLKYLRKIVGRDMGEFFDVSSDNHDNLYVADYDNSCVRVVCRCGDFLRTISTDGNGGNKLNKPSYVWVDRQYVYVANYGCHSVSVFTTEGKYVTSFGQEGNKDGEFSTPRGVCVDRNGFLYVCDFDNHRIQVL